MKTKNYVSYSLSVFVFFFGLFGLYVATDGGQAWTAETARRLYVKESPILLPNLVLVNSNGELQTPFSENEKKGVSSPLILMEFIYTSCPTICLAMGAEFAHLQNRIFDSKQQTNIKLLSISFDPVDELPDLENYLKRFGGQIDIWSAAKFRSDAKLIQTMKQLGAIAIPDPLFGYVHNSAVYVVNNGKVVAMLNHDDQKGIQLELDKYLNSLNQNKRK